MNYEVTYSLGIDIGASQVRFILADSRNGNLAINDNRVSKDICLSPSYSQFDINDYPALKSLPQKEIFHSYIIFKLKEYLEKSHVSLEQIDSIGISLAGRILQGGIFICSNLPLKYTSQFGSFSGVDLLNPIQEAFPGKKIVIENDGVCAGIAQAAYYEYLGIDPLKTFYITHSTGIGGGGPQRDIDEIGHTIIGNVFPGLKMRCGCGAIGCIESTTSGTGIKNLTNKILQLFCTDKALFGELNGYEFLRTQHRYTLGQLVEKSPLLREYKSGKVIEPKRVFELAGAFYLSGGGDEFAYYIVNSAAERFAALLVSLANIHGIERFGIGGSVSSKNPFFLDIVNKYIQQIRADVNHSFSPDITVELSPFGEYINDYGALFLTIDNPDTRKEWIKYFIEHVKQ
ncbi:MAG: ROK family protein [candidate division Zixibacteria bacterium]|nr:ROK family protein [candidate division Zixibacteria bacterium]